MCLNTKTLSRNSIITNKKNVKNNSKKNLKLFLMNNEVKQNTHLMIKTLYILLIKQLPLRFRIEKLKREDYCDIFISKMKVGNFH